MDIDLIFKIAAIGIIVAVLNQLLVRSGREEQALMVTLAALIIVMMVMVQQISDLSWERYLPCCSGRKSRFWPFLSFSPWYWRRSRFCGKHW